MGSHLGEVIQMQLQLPGNNYSSYPSRSSLNSEYSALESSSRLSAMQSTTVLHHQSVVSCVCCFVRIESLIELGIALASLCNECLCLKHAEVSISCCIESLQSRNWHCLDAKGINWFSLVSKATGPCEKMKRLILKQIHLVCAAFGTCQFSMQWYLLRASWSPQASRAALCHEDWTQSAEDFISVALKIGWEASWNGRWISHRSQFGSNISTQYLDQCPPNTSTLHGSNWQLLAGRWSVLIMI